MDKLKEEVVQHSYRENLERSLFCLHNSPVFHATILKVIDISLIL